MRSAKLKIPATFCPHGMVIVFLALNLVATSVQGCLSKGQGQRHGVNPTTKCTSTTDCFTPTTFMRCASSGVCDCSMESHFINSPESQSCRLVAGASCKILSKVKGQGDGPGQVQECVPNSVCYSENPLALRGSCTCDSDAVETMSGMCKKKRDSESSAFSVILKPGFDLTFILSSVFPIFIVMCYNCIHSVQM